MSLPAEAEFTTECKVGWRGWVQVAQPGFLISMRMVWLHEERTEAVCRGERHEGEDVPGVGCNCGIYAFKTPERVFREGYHKQAILGEVWLWGKVIEHTQGWKAAYAYPKKFYATLEMIKDQPTGFLEYVAFRYGVPLEVISEEHELVAPSQEERRRRELEERLAREEKVREAARKRMNTVATRKGVEARLAQLPATLPGFRNLLEQTEAEVREEVKRRLAKG